MKPDEINDSEVAGNSDTGIRDAKPHGRAEPLPKEERSARGRAAREAVPRSSHGKWQPSGDRRDPVDVLEEQAATRVPDLVPIRYGRMLVSPFTFYRGAAAVMAADLAPSPQSGLTVQLCGDAHLSNFGGFAAPDRRLVFSLNDFDETLPGPFEWDVKRLAASFEVAGRDQGFEAARRASVNRSVGRSYREAMTSFAQMRTLDIWYLRLDVDDVRKRWSSVSNRSNLRFFDRRHVKARLKDSVRAFDKLTRVVDGRRCFVSDPPLIVPLDDLMSPEQHVGFDRWLGRAIHAYWRSLPADRRQLFDRFRYVHCARKVVGVGSVGTGAWIALFVGNDDSDPLVLQIKEAQPSALERFLGASGFANHGQRVVDGQRMMQATSDIMLGWFKIEGIDGVQRDYYVRQLWDNKWSPTIEMMDEGQLETYATFCGWTLARAHARSGDPVAIASYLGRRGTFDESMAAFAVAYADQNDQDYTALRRAVDSGRITAHLDL